MKDNYFLIVLVFKFLLLDQHSERFKFLEFKMVERRNRYITQNYTF